MAAAIMAMAIATSITTMQRGFANIDTARNLTVAGQILQTEMEKMRMNSWTTVDGYQPGPTTLTVDTLFSSNPVIGSRFALTRSTESPQTGMKKVSFEVTWKNYDGRTLKRSYMTYYSQYGLYDYYFNSVP